MLGAYYTPADVAEMLCRWAIRDRSDLVLEPSFGGCEFIASARSALEAKCCPDPLSNIFGADVDPAAFSSLRERGFYPKPNRFKQANFLALKPHDFGIDGVDVVVGNPPYVRHHHFNDEVRLSAKAVKKTVGVPLPLQANLWAFFVLHSCGFLKEGGRAAFVLPQNFLHASYATHVRDYLSDHFSSVTAIVIKEQLFEHEGASEKSVLLLAEDWRRSSGARADLVLRHADRVSEAEHLLDKTKQTPPESGHRLEGLTRAWARSVPLGDICEVRIGLVTGDLSYFLFDKAKADSEGIPWNCLRPFLARADVSPGLVVNRSTLIEAFDVGKKAAVLDTTGPGAGSAERYLKSVAPAKIARNATYRKRPVWHQPFDGYVADLFFTSMSHKLPRLILNPDGVDCSNSLYRLKVRSQENADLTMIALSLISSFGQLSSEIEGRPYSSGLLKHEPSDVRRIRVFCDRGDEPDAVQAFHLAHASLAGGEVEHAQEVADSFFVRTGHITPQELADVRGMLDRKRKLRLRSPS